MNWVWFSIGAVGGLFLLYSKGTRSARNKRKAWVNSPPKATTPEGTVEEALVSGDVHYMAATLDQTRDPILRDALLGQIVAETYRQRSDADAKEAFYRYARQHVEEIPGVLEALAAEGRERPEKIDTLRMLAIAMEQDGRFDEAIEICEKALSLGVQNGTKTGFEGRIARITRRRDAPE